MGRSHGKITGNTVIEYPEKNAILGSE